ncbi:MAG: hypothetical protein SPK34_06255 [Bacteroidaceae bacterium]|nr:hypothetical protein [Bacteroidaceae bacterium]
MKSPFSLHSITRGWKPYSVSVPSIPTTANAGLPKNRTPDRNGKGNNPVFPLSDHGRRRTSMVD